MWCGMVDIIFKQNSKFPFRSKIFRLINDNSLKTSIQKHSMQCCQFDNMKSDMFDFARSVSCMYSSQAETSVGFRMNERMSSHQAHTHNNYRPWIAIHKSRRQTQSEEKKNQLIESRQEIQKKFCFVNALILILLYLIVLLNIFFLFRKYLIIVCECQFVN